MAHPFDRMARDAVANLCEGLTATGEGPLRDPVSFKVTADAQAAVVDVLERLAMRIGDPALAQLSPLPLLLLRHLAQSGLTSAEAIAGFPVDDVAEAIRRKPAILIKPIPLSEIISL